MPGSCSRRSHQPMPLSPRKRPGVVPPARRRASLVRRRWRSSATRPSSAAASPLAPLPPSAAAPHSSTSAVPAAPWHSERSSISYGSAARGGAGSSPARSRRRARYGPVTEQCDGAQTASARCRASPWHHVPVAGDASAAPAAALAADAEVRPRAGRRVEPRPLVGEGARRAGAEPLVAGRRRTARAAPSRCPPRRATSPQR